MSALAAVLAAPAPSCEPNEPSEKGFMVWRIGGGIIAIVGVVLVVVAITKF